MELSSSYWLLQLGKGEFDTNAAGYSLKMDAHYGYFFFSYSGTGLQAVLELYFTRFLFVCLTQADQLGTAAVNVYIALYQICALSAGFLADRILGEHHTHKNIWYYCWIEHCIIIIFRTGNFLTQVLSTLLTTIGICLLSFSTWQYTVSPPGCCVDNSNNKSLYLPRDEYSGSFNWSSNCSELDKVTILNQIDLNISPTLNMVLSIIGLTVRTVLNHSVCYFENYPPPSFSLLGTGTSMLYRVFLLQTSLQKNRWHTHSLTSRCQKGRKDFWRLFKFLPPPADACLRD